MKKSLKLTPKLIFSLSVLFLSSLIIAESCEPDGYHPICEVGECLKIESLNEDYVKIVDKTNVVINAKGLAGNMDPLSEVNDTDRSIQAPKASLNRRALFSIKHPRAESAMILVNRSHVTKDTVSLDAAVADCKNGSESTDNFVAKRVGGGTCRTYKTGDKVLNYYSYLGTIFDNTNTQKARAAMWCIGSFSDVFGISAITDDTKFGGRGATTIGCSLLVVNNGLGNTVEIDDNWVDGSGGTATEEVELYITSLDFTGKTIPQFIPDTTTFNLAAYNKALSNATFKNLFRNNRGEDLKIKVKIVKSADY